MPFPAKKSEVENHARQAASAGIVMGGDMISLFGPAAIASFVDWLERLFVSWPDRFAFGGFFDGLFTGRRFADRVQ